MLSRLKNTGWLSSVKTVALKRENTHRECGGLRAEDSLEYSRIWLLLRRWQTEQRMPPKRLVYGRLVQKQQALKTVVGLEG